MRVDSQNRIEPMNEVGCSMKREGNHGLEISRISQRSTYSQRSTQMRNRRKTIIMVTQSLQKKRRIFGKLAQVMRMMKSTRISYQRAISPNTAVDAATAAFRPTSIGRTRPFSRFSLLDAINASQRSTVVSD